MTLHLITIALCKYMHSLQCTLYISNKISFVFQIIVLVLLNLFPINLKYNNPFLAKILHHVYDNQID